VSGVCHTELIAPRSVDSRCRPKADAHADHGSEPLGPLTGAAPGVCGQGHHWARRCRVPTGRLRTMWCVFRHRWRAFRDTAGSNP